MRDASGITKEKGRLRLQGHGQEGLALDFENHSVTI